MRSPRDINDDMKLAASYAIASLAAEDELSPTRILPEAPSEAAWRGCR